MIGLTFNVQDNSEQVLKDLEDATPSAMIKCGLVAVGYAKRLCPVDTGRLRNSISYAVKGKAVYIGTNVEYAPYVEMGTSRTRAQPFIRPAAEGHSDVYRRILKESL